MAPSFLPYPSFASCGRKVIPTGAAAAALFYLSLTSRYKASRFPAMSSPFSIAATTIWFLTTAAATSKRIIFPHDTGIALFDTYYAMLDGKRGRRSRRRASACQARLLLYPSSTRSASPVYSLGAATRYNCRSTPLEDDLAASQCMYLWHSTIGLQM